MQKSILSLLLSILLLLSVVFFAAAQEPPKGPEPTPNTSEPQATTTPTPAPSLQIDFALRSKIEPQLLKQLVDNQGNPAPFIVYLKQQADVELAVAAASANLGILGEPDPLTKRTVIVNTLQQTAQNTQQGVLQTLSAPPTSGISGQSAAATDIKPLWIINAVAAAGSLDTVLALAARPDVEIVRLDKTIQINRPNLIANASFADLSPPYRIPRLMVPLAQPTPEWGISKIRADLVHSALGINGMGVVVANIDTGVDWLHPDLTTNYRGYTGPGKLPTHTGNWFDATGAGAVYPVDSHGHGTHTMGTAVGQNGIGVAPGAKWVAMRVFDSSGSALNSWIHAAFQWTLAPNGNPAMAPDIVNNSWGSDNGFSTEFESDIDTLLAAGIFPVFSAGNNGPGAGTVGSPGSNTNAFSVGATTINDEIANFSSRGPSPWGKIKPEVSAPGKDVRSALPGGTYGVWDGTSMAAPHVSGLAALLMQASPLLSSNLASLVNTLKTTAVPLGSPIPNNDFGWGRVDAYNAVTSASMAGTLQGTITNSVTGSPIENATVQIEPSLGGPATQTTADAAGFYIQGLAPDIYNVDASAFGYQLSSTKLVTISASSIKTENFSLTPLPTGFLTGIVTSKDGGALLNATITIEGTPVSTNTVNGVYNLELPTGVYTVTAVAASHRISRVMNITITTGITAIQNFSLESAPSILLVDSGAWYQESQITYYQQALNDADYTYDLWQITKLSDYVYNIPSVAYLSNYDIVIWSSPLDSPGYIEADDEIETYLSSGGKLLLSGQDVAYFDGGGYIFGSAPYLNDYLKIDYEADNSDIEIVEGVVDQPFEGMLLSLNSGDGANNQSTPDVISVNDPDFAGPLLQYQNSDYLAGAHVGLCLNYRATFMGFGIEGIDSRADRSEIVEQSIDWLTGDFAAAGVELTPLEETIIGNFGTSVTHTVRLRNTGISTDTISLTRTNPGPYNWVTGTLPPSVVLGACASQELTVPVQVPATYTWHITDTFTITATSGNAVTATDVVTRHTKTPAPVLLVDDDRWYSFADKFKEALALKNIPYDYWYVPKSWSGPVPPSPPLVTLQMYPMVVWYTAYDWYQPLTPTEENRLAQYLNNGGRLFFSSQDFLYVHLNNNGGDYGPFATDYLGVESHIEDYASTTATGELGNFVGTHLGPYSLTFPAGYRNWTDAVTPTSSAQIATRGQEDQPNGLTNAGPALGGKTWHTNFLAYGPELLDTPDRGRLMQRSLGWLSWLGASTVEASAPAVTNGSMITYTATITNDGWLPISTATVTATFPTYLTAGTASPGVVKNGETFIWADSLAVGQSKSFTYSAQINQPLPVGTVINQTSWLFYPEHNILFDRITDVDTSPMFDTSTMEVDPWQEIVDGDVLTYTITLRNSGLVDEPSVTTTNTLPQGLELIAANPPSDGSSVVTGSNSLTWTTSLAKNEVATLTYRAAVSGAIGSVIKNEATIKNSLNQTVTVSAEALLKPKILYLPVIMKNN